MRTPLSRSLCPLVVALVVLFGSHSAFAQKQTLTINAYPPVLPSEVAGTAWFIFLDGVIDHEAPQRLEKYITEHNVPVFSFVYLNSPGGDLLAGLELGRVIRKHRFSTNIGSKSPNSSKRYDVDPAGCYSACAYTYLGGQFRYLIKGSSYGVHRFAPSGKSNVSIDTAQLASAAIVQYIREMGIDPILYGSASTAGPDQMNVLDRRTLEAMDIVNNGATHPKWTIESVGGEIYLKGERITDISGINKFIIICDRRRPALYAIFSTLNRGRELMAMSAASLLIDEKSSPIKVLSKSIQNENFNGIFRLTATQIQAIQTAETVGVAMQFAYGAPMFLGFQDMPIGEGREKLAGFLNSCRGQ